MLVSWTDVDGEDQKKAHLSVGASSEVSLKVTEADISNLTASIRSPSGLEEPCVLKRLANGHLGIGTFIYCISLILMCFSFSKEIKVKLIPHPAWLFGPEMICWLPAVIWPLPVIWLGDKPSSSLPLLSAHLQTAVVFVTAKHHLPVTSTKLHWLAAEACIWNGCKSNLQYALRIEHHYTTVPHFVKVPCREQICYLLGISLRLYIICNTCIHWIKRYRTNVGSVVVMLLTLRNVTTVAR